MLRTLALALACVLVAAPVAEAKKHKSHARVAKHAKHAKPTRAEKRATALARVVDAPPPTRVASVEHRPAQPPAEVTSSPPRAAAPEPVASPPVEHGPLGPQAGDDEVPGSRMKKR
jgi:hypothetical protein